MTKFKPIKSCSCKACRRGKTPDKTRTVERCFRRISKVELKRDIIAFVNRPFAGGYYD